MIALRIVCSVLALFFLFYAIIGFWGKQPLVLIAGPEATIVFSALVASFFAAVFADSFRPVVYVEISAKDEEG